MPTITSRVPYIEGGPQKPCVWCGGPTDIKAATPFRPDLGHLPLHLTCGADLIQVYDMIREGRTLTTRQQKGVKRLQNLPQLT